MGASPGGGARLKGKRCGLGQGAGSEGPQVGGGSGTGVDEMHFRGNLKGVVASLWSGLREEGLESRMTFIFLVSYAGGGGEGRGQNRRVDDHFGFNLKGPAGHSSVRMRSRRQLQGAGGGGERGRGVWEVGCGGL